MKGLEKLPRLRPIQIEVKSPEFEGVEDVMLFLVANSNSVGGFEKLAPLASLDDGLLDVLILRKCNLAEFLRIASMALRGEHINDDHIIYFRTSEIQITAKDYVQLNLDGEFGGTMPVKFSVLPSHLEMIVDETGISSYKDK
jgi:diacylglycerol kinase (ATP)